MNTFKTKKGTELPLLNLKGKDYLQVAYRLVFFREEHPTWGIETSIVNINDTSATVYACVKDDHGRVISSSHQTETVRGFPKFLAKAETAAVGRALAMAGFGTQFEPEFEDDEASLADAPIERRVFPDQPTSRDGSTEVDPSRYKFPNGKYAGRYLDEVDHTELRGHVEYFDKQIASGKTLTPEVTERINIISTYLATFENTPIEQVKPLDVSPEDKLELDSLTDNELKKRFEKAWSMKQITSPKVWAKFTYLTNIYSKKFNIKIDERNKPEFIGKKYE